MKHKTLQDLIGRAIIDRSFRTRLLNGGKEQALAEYNLTDAEARALRSIQAQSFEEFAGKLHAWIERGDGRHTYDYPQPSSTF